MQEHETETGEDTDYALLPLLRHYEERRRYPRIELRVPAIVTTSDHQVLKARLRNLSSEGVQLRCDPDTARALHPSGASILPGTGPEVLMRLELPVDGEPRPFAAHAQVCYIAVRSTEEIAFGLRFTRVDLDAKGVLAAFITESLRPRD